LLSGFAIGHSEQRRVTLLVIHNNVEVNVKFLDKLLHASTVKMEVV